MWERLPSLEKSIGVRKPLPQTINGERGI